MELTEEEKQDNHQLQVEELETIKVIYEEDVEDITETENKIKFKLILKVTVTDPIKISLKSNNFVVGIIEVEYLPPLEILIDFPESYPRQGPPKIDIQAIWITHTNKMKIYEKVDEICTNQSGEAVVFEVTNWIQSELIEFLFNNNSNANGFDVEDDLTDINNDKFEFYFSQFSQKKIKKNWEKKGKEKGRILRRKEEF